MKKSLMTAAMLLAASLIPLQSYAAAFACEVTVKEVLVYKDGQVNVFHTGRNDYTVICNLTREAQGVAPATCAAWTSVLMAVKKKNGLARFWWDGTGSCATLPTYGNAPAPTYIGDVTP